MHREMDEEQLASALSAHMDAMLAGQPLPVEDGPEEVRQLLALAEQLATGDLLPRPAFGQQLRRSLLDRGHGGGSGTSGSGGLPSWLVLVLGAVVSLMGMGALAVILAVTVVLPQHNPRPTPTLPAPSPTAMPAPTGAPVLPTPRPSAKATATHVDTIRPTLGPTTDQLAPKATPSSILPLERGDQLTGGSTGGDSNGDSPHTDDHGCRWMR